MELKLEEVGDYRGAPMGRQSIIPTLGDEEIKEIDLYFTPLRMVDGDYDTGGAYWGACEDSATYCFYGESPEGNEIQMFTRASNATEASRRFAEDLRKQQPEIRVTAHIQRQDGYIPFCDLSDFDRGYFEALFFIAPEDMLSRGSAFHWYDKIHPENLKKQLEETQQFFEKAQDLLYQAEERSRPMDHLGHDFALTRCGAGVGFWDRDELKEGGLGDKLTEIAEAFGNVDVSYNSDPDATDEEDFVYIE